MRIIKTVLVVLALSALPLRAADTPNSALEQIVDRIVSTEQTEMNSLKPFTPLVETYIQNLRGDNNLGSVPAGDKYFLGRAVLAKGVDLDPLTDGSDSRGGRLRGAIAAHQQRLMAMVPDKAKAFLRDTKSSKLNMGTLSTVMGHALEYADPVSLAETPSFRVVNYLAGG